jgi:heat shock protein HslJ
MKRRLGLTLLVALVFLLAACGKSTSTNSITGIVWQWTAMQETVPASQSVVPNPQNYTIIFNMDNTVTIKADCNQVGGTYTVSGSNLTIILGPSTLMYCGDASLDQIYLASLRSPVTRSSTISSSSNLPMMAAKWISITAAKLNSTT